MKEKEKCLEKFFEVFVLNFVTMKYKLSWFNFFDLLMYIFPFVFPSVQFVVIYNNDAGQK